MIKTIKNKEFYICDICEEITFDKFLISTLFKRDDDPQHFHIACLEYYMGRALEIEDLTMNTANFELLYTYSIWCPECEFRKHGRCKLDRKKCKGWCRYKTESKNRIEGSLMINQIKKKGEYYE